MALAAAHSDAAAGRSAPMRQTTALHIWAISHHPGIHRHVSHHEAEGDGAGTAGHAKPTSGTEDKTGSAPMG